MSTEIETLTMKLKKLKDDSGSSDIPGSSGTVQKQIRASPSHKVYYQSLKHIQSIKSVHESYIMNRNHNRLWLYTNRVEMDIIVHAAAGVM